MDQRDVERILRRGGQLLAEALYAYWPMNGVNEAAERNITLQLARSFGEAGFMIYAEGHREGSTKTRLDLLALNLKDGIQVAVEAKRLYSDEKAKAMLHDVERVAKFRIAKNDFMSGDPPRRRFGVVTAITWSDEYAHWFSRKEANNPGKDEIWNALYKHKSLKKATWGNVVLRGWDIRRPDEHFHYLVYVIFEIK